MDTSFNTTPLTEVSNSNPRTLVGIDLSINATAVAIHRPHEEYVHYGLFVQEHLIKPKSALWKNIYQTPDLFTLRSYPHQRGDSPINRLHNYQGIAREVATLVAEHTEGDLSIFLEHYAYSARTNIILDLVEIGTCVRLALLSHGLDYTLVSPLALKRQACWRVYQIRDAKGVVRTPEGMAANKMNKPQMVSAVMAEPGALSTYLHAHPWKGAQPPKPYDDLCDAHHLARWQPII